MKESAARPMGEMGLESLPRSKRGSDTLPRPSSAAGRIPTPERGNDLPNPSQSRLELIARSVS